VSLADRTRRWTFDDALPVWAEIGVDQRMGGFVERLHADGRPDIDAPFKRVRGQARMIYAFSHAATLGFAPGAEIAERGLRFLQDHAALPGGGWARTLTRDGAIHDSVLDLYEQACMLLALAWLHRATDDPGPIRLAEQGFAAVKQRLGRGPGGGFRAADPGGDEGLQNPHMHLLEAMLALFQATGDPVWAEEARALAQLFCERLFDPATGTLGERFDGDWKRAQPARLEPGHHYEWVWLLHATDRVLGGDRTAPAEALFGFAERCGVNPQMGLAWDEIEADGTVCAPTHRLWPQAERLKAVLARSRRTGDQAALADVVDGIFARYLDPAPRGCWLDRLDADGRALGGPLPTSSLYHLFVAFSELWRPA
jgi:mannose/cellobiose epimerase-like protein (N-acyl-D-glucosamine 2-epimerase family)